MWKLYGLLCLGLVFGTSTMDNKIDIQALNNKIGISLACRHNELEFFKKEYGMQHKPLKAVKNDLNHYKDEDKEKYNWIIERLLEERTDVIKYCLENKLYSFEWCINTIYKKHSNTMFDSVSSLETAFKSAALNHDKKPIKDKLEEHWVFGENTFKAVFCKRHKLSKMYDDFVLYSLEDKNFEKTVQCDRFHRFLWNVVHYYEIMKYFSNFNDFEHFNDTKIINDLEQMVSSEGGFKVLSKYNLALIPELMLLSNYKDTNYASLCLEKIITEYKKADAEKQQDFLNAARWFGHDQFLLCVHFNKKFSECKRVNNIRFCYV